MGLRGTETRPTMKVEYVDSVIPDIPPQTFGNE